jgi:Neutral/alkaline non-lysosomal ceramidase, N-terminal
MMNNNRLRPFGLSAGVIILLMAGVIVSPIAQIQADEPADNKKHEGSFRASCVKVDVTPEKPQWLQGYAPRQSVGVHDNIYHRIVAMDDGKTQFYLVSSDFCTIGPSFYDDFCKRLEKETGIKPEQFWWSVTHTHAAPEVGPMGVAKLFVSSLGDRFSHKPNTEYTKRISDLLIQGIKDARSKLEPARLGVGTGTSYANINRRGKNGDGRSILGVDPEGPVDRQIGLIRLERPDGSLIGLITNYAIHGTVLGTLNKLISGDVQGIVSEYVEKKVGVPMLFINGAEGDVAPIYSVRADFAHSHLGEFHSLLGNKILDANQSIKSTTSDVTFSSEKIFIETQRKLGLGWLEEMADYSRINNKGIKLVRVPAYSLTINNETVLWAAPLELFGEIALNVRKASPFKNTFYYGLTNGSLLYMPTKKAFAEGGYEPSVSVVTDQAEEDYTTGVIQHIKKLATQK